MEHTLKALNLLRVIRQAVRPSVPSPQPLNLLNTHTDTLSAHMLKARKPHVKNVLFPGVVLSFMINKDVP